MKARALIAVFVLFAAGLVSWVIRNGQPSPAPSTSVEPESETAPAVTPPENNSTPQPEAVPSAAPPSARDGLLAAALDTLPLVCAAEPDGDLVRQWIHPDRIETVLPSICKLASPPAAQVFARRCGEPPCYQTRQPSPQANLGELDVDPTQCFEAVAGDATITACSPSEVQLLFVDIRGLETL